MTLRWRGENTKIAIDDEDRRFNFQKWQIVNVIVIENWQHCKTSCHWPENPYWKLTSTWSSNDIFVMCDVSKFCSWRLAMPFTMTLTISHQIEVTLLSLMKRHGHSIGLSGVLCWDCWWKRKKVIPTQLNGWKGKKHCCSKWKYIQRSRLGLLTDGSKCEWLLLINFLFLSAFTNESIKQLKNSLILFAIFSIKYIVMLKKKRFQWLKVKEHRSLSANKVFSF